MENMHNPPWQPYTPAGGNIPNTPQPPAEKPFFPTGKRELIFAVLILVSGLCLCNFTLFGGFSLGFSIAAVACIGCLFGYLLARGHRPTFYTAALLGLCAVTAAGFARSDDGFVKFVLVCFLSVGVNLGICLLAGQNLRSAGSVRSLLDAPRAVFRLGLGRFPAACEGFRLAFRRSGTVGQKCSAFLLGLCICIPVLAILIPLLISADAAFDGLVALLPEFDFYEFVVTAVAGSALSAVLYVRGIALHHSPRQAPSRRSARGLNTITLNTVLGGVCAVYLAYLFSQLAYFVGGFSGILPEEFTVAQYARRGFFEMAWLCAIDLGLICLSLGLVKKQERAPLMTRLLCLFIGVVTLFLVAAASAKMFLYIGSYGLTRLRVLTQIIMLFLALTTALVMVWLFVPRLPYMKAVLLIALTIGAATLWADVDTCVARYNVDVYLSGRLETVDVSYLFTLSDGAVPYIAKLAEEAADEEVVKHAQNFLQYGRDSQLHEDFRGWNYVNYIAARFLPPKE